MDYATRFPKVIPLWNTTACTIAAELLKVFTCVGLPWEILTKRYQIHVQTASSGVCSYGDQEATDLRLSPPDRWAGQTLQQDTKGDAPYVLIGAPPVGLTDPALTVGH